MLPACPPSADKARGRPSGISEPKVRVLLAAGADRSMVNDEGQTAEDAAASDVLTAAAFALVEHAEL